MRTPETVLGVFLLFLHESICRLCFFLGLKCLARTHQETSTTASASALCQISLFDVRRAVAGQDFDEFEDDDWPEGSEEQEKYYWQEDWDNTDIRFVFVFLWRLDVVEGNRFRTAIILTFSSVLVLQRRVFSAAHARAAEKGSRSRTTPDVSL